MNTRQAKQIPITEYLAHLGYGPVKTGPKGAWYHSMLTPGVDKTPSFQVSADGHAFHDWSTGASGNIIDLAMCITGKHNISAALASIESVVERICSAVIPSPSFSLYKRETTLKIVSVDKLSTPALLTCVRRRGVSIDIARTYCSEVRYRFTDSGKVFYAIGWRNNSDGWELRNSFTKLAAAPKDITTVNDLCNCPYLVFEGFFDFLSAATISWFRPSEMNAVVLNSTGQLNRAIPLLKEASRIICLLDNDNSGREATERIKRTYPSAEDHSNLFGGYKDLNEYLMNNSINK